MQYISKTSAYFKFFIIIVLIDIIKYIYVCVCVFVYIYIYVCVYFLIILLPRHPIHKLTLPTHSALLNINNISV